MLPSHCGVTNVKPSPPPVLDRFRHIERKEKNIGLEGDDATPNGIYTIRTGLPFHGIEFPEEAKVWLDTEPALAESDETSNVKKRIGGKMMQLDVVKKEQSTKEVMDWEGKSANNEGKEHNPIPNGGTGDYLIAWEFDDLPIPRDQAPLAKLAEITLSRLRSPPATVGDTGSGGTLFPSSSAGTNRRRRLLRLLHRDTVGPAARAQDGRRKCGRIFQHAARTL